MFFEPAVDVVQCDENGGRLVQRVEIGVFATEQLVNEGFHLRLRELFSPRYGRFRCVCRCKFFILLQLHGAAVMLVLMQYGFDHRTLIAEGQI